MPVIALAFLIGVFGGLRSLTAPAVVAWSVYLGHLRPVHPLSLIGSFPAVVVLTVLALFEFVADKLPRTPSRTEALGLSGRIIMGGLSGAAIASGGAMGSMTGAVAGALGGIVGCYGGYYARARLVRQLRTRDLYVAVVEDLVAIAGSLWIVSRFH